MTEKNTTVEFIGIPQLARRWKLSRMGALKRTRDCDFPSPAVQIGRTKGWELEAIEAWERAGGVWAKFGWHRLVDVRITFSTKPPFEYRERLQAYGLSWDGSAWVGQLNRTMLRLIVGHRLLPEAEEEFRLLSGQVAVTALPIGHDDSAVTALFEKHFGKDALKNLAAKAALVSSET